MNIVEIAPIRRVTIPPVKSLVPQAIPAKSAKTAAKIVEFKGPILPVSVQDVIARGADALLAMTKQTGIIFKTWYARKNFSSTGVRAAGVRV